MQGSNPGLLYCWGILYQLSHKRSPGDIKVVDLIPALEDPLEEGMAIHSSTLAWRIPPTEKSGSLQSIGSQRVRHDWNNLACTHTCMHVCVLVTQSCPVLYNPMDYRLPGYSVHEIQLLCVQYPSQEHRKSLVMWWTKTLIWISWWYKIQ